MAKSQMKILWSEVATCHKESAKNGDEQSNLLEYHLLCLKKISTAYLQKFHIP